MVPVTRPLHGRGRRRFHDHAHPAAPKNSRTPLRATTLVTRPLPFSTGGRVFAGMDPSDPGTYVRPFRPQDGMIGRLNFNGAMMQDNTETGGVYGLPAAQTARAGVRPKRRPR